MKKVGLIDQVLASLQDHHNTPFGYEEAEKRINAMGNYAFLELLEEGLTYWLAPENDDGVPTPTRSERWAGLTDTPPAR